MSEKTKTVIDGILGAAFLLVAIALLIVSVMFWITPMFDADRFTQIVTKLIPTILFAAAVVASVIFQKKFFKRLK